MHNTKIIALLAGLVAGYFLAPKLVGNTLGAKVYGVGASLKAP